VAEIKSTLDLIMEKTRHLALNDEEKQAFEQEQLSRKVQAPVMRYLKEERDADFLAHELNLLPPEKRKEGIRLSLALFLDRLSPFDDNARILSGVERLLGEKARKRWEEAVAPLAEACREERAKAQADVAGHFREALAAVGLQGSALLPCTDEQGPLSKEEEERTQAFRKRVKESLDQM